jgi:hypothetical protein
VCRELTKTYEEVRRGGLRELADWAAAGVRGEVTLVVHGAPSPGPVGDDAVVARVAELEEEGRSRRDAIAAVLPRPACGDGRCTTWCTGRDPGGRCIDIGVARAAAMSTDSYAGDPTCSMYRHGVARTTAMSIDP